jgi:hypothetical protein
VDEVDDATGVPIAEKAGKVRKLFLFLFLALAGSSKIPTQKRVRMPSRTKGTIMRSTS